VGLKGAAQRPLTRSLADNFGELRPYTTTAEILLVRQKTELAEARAEPKALSKDSKDK
jgi:hypothetical protein